MDDMDKILGPNWGGGELGQRANEIVRLREELHYLRGTCDLAMKHRDAAEAENGRLRTALQSITDLCKTSPANPFLADDMDRIARAAISTGKCDG
jgi:hypothetical protein